MSDDLDQGQERRRATRRRTLLSGILLHGPASLTVDCAVRDVSDTGAQVRMFAIGYLARPTILLIPKLDRAWEVAVAWQRGASFGLTFAREIDLRAEATSEPDGAARRIWRARGGR